VNDRPGGGGLRLRNGRSRRIAGGRGRIGGDHLELHPGGPDAFLLPGVDLSFDTIKYTNFPVVVLNLNAPSALLGFQLGGIVGHKFLSKYRVGIDLERSVLRLKNGS
jgi:hypothetical protein